ncbi:MAG: CHAT domain-containing tetratricopeptide repeat protein [Saprospiraceae bacterium]
MKHKLLFLLLFGLNALAAQKTNSRIIKQVDSLLQASSFYLELPDPDRAFEVLNRAEIITRKKIGMETPAYGTCAHNFGVMYHYKGDYSNSEKWYLKAKAIREKVFGKENDHYIESVLDLANLYRRKGENQKAEVLFREITSINKQRLEKAQGYLSESELNRFLNRLLPMEHQILSFMQSEGAKDLTASLYDNSLFYKGFLLQAANRIQRLVRANPGATKTYHLLKKKNEQLANLYSTPCSQRDTAMITTMYKQIEVLEKELARIVAGYADSKRQVYWRDVQSVLKPGEVAVEFVHYPFYRAQKTDSTFYAALLLRPGNTLPLFTVLFEEAEMDNLIFTQVERKADYANQLYATSDRGAIEITNPKRSLYSLIWKPLEKHLEGVHTIYCSNDGLLHRLNLGAISYNKDQTFSDRYRLVELGSTRQLALSSEVQNLGHDAVLYGGLNYEPDTSKIQTLMQDSAPLLAELSFDRVDRNLRSGSWNYLDGTDKEVKAIQKLLTASGSSVVMKNGDDGTEESFKAMGVSNPSPRVLHIATHGYFFPDHAGDEFSFGSSSYNAQPVFKTSDHPMLRSGLILSGGNGGWMGTSKANGREDGVVTAYEISQMNLSNTELVVLSACETGLGDIQGNEGVYGLQRAFKIAGAKYLIMSLWQVPDKQTSLLMTTFYKKWLEEKMTIPDAFHAAQKELRDGGLDPYNWAGFVLVE